MRGSDVRQQVHVFGGEWLNEIVDGQEFTLPHKDVLAHDADNWSVVARMPTPRSRCHAIPAPSRRFQVIGTEQILSAPAPARDSG